ncbi:MAG TPA: peptide ABC transporter substrate-binding protein [Candidatus Dormibacteraeota bacterium]|nr:peptide ABC transporter substrate-binding protein [Candidatus Dormibacteraeota bacterium]
MAAVVALAGCQPVATVPRAARGGTAVEALVGQATVLNPLFETNESTRDVNSLIYQGLTSVDSSQNVIGLLAQDWTVSPDHLTYTFDLRTDAKWADGEPFGVDDVLFTFHVLQDLEYQQPGAEDWRQLGIVAGGPGQVVFSLRAPDASFPLSLRIGIIPKHIFSGMAPSQIMASPHSGIQAFGTGPFKVGSINQLAITLDRNPYASPQPYLDHLVLRTYPATDPQSAIRAVLTGAADLVGGIQPQEVDTLISRQGLTVQEARMFTNAFVTFNADGDGKQFFSDPSVRLALVQAVDRQRVVSDVFAGRADADPNPIPTADWAYSAAAATLHPFDAIAASSAMDKAGWTIDPVSKLRTKNKVPFKVTLVAANSYPNQEIANAISAQLLTIGVEVDVKPVPASSLLQDYLLSRKYQMALISIDVGSDPDQYSLWHSGSDPGSLNFAYSRGWGLIDKDLEDGRAAVDTPSRLAAYIDFQVLMAQAAPAIFISASRYEYAVSQRVHGVHLNKAIEPYDRFQYVTDWYVNTTG